MARKTSYSGFLAVARLEQLADDWDPSGADDGPLADYLVSRAVSTTFLPRRRQIQITFDLPTDDDPTQEPT